MSETVTRESDAPAPRRGEPLMEVRDLVKHFPLTSGIIFQRKVGAVQAVDGISFDVMHDVAAEGSAVQAAGDTGSRAASVVEDPATEETGA